MESPSTLSSLRRSWLRSSLAVPINRDSCQQPAPPSPWNSIRLRTMEVQPCPTTISITVSTLQIVMPLCKHTMDSHLCGRLTNQMKLNSKPEPCTTLKSPLSMRLATSQTFLTLLLLRWPTKLHSLRSPPWTELRAR